MVGFFHFVIIFKSLVLGAELELEKKLGHYEYLLLVKRSFPVSFAQQLPGARSYPHLKLHKKAKNPEI